jgi:hypothetical protein
MKKLDLSREG